MAVSLLVATVPLLIIFKPPSPPQNPGRSGKYLTAGVGGRIMSYKQADQYGVIR